MLRNKENLLPAVWLKSYFPVDIDLFFNCAKQKYFLY